MAKTKQTTEECEEPSEGNEGNPEFIPCAIKKLTDAQQMKAFKLAQEENPARMPGGKVKPDFLAVDLRRWWTDKGKTFTVDFVDGASNELRAKVLHYANLWNKYANVKFVDAQTDAMVRVSFGSGGYWSYLGTDILGIPKNEATMNLERFTVNTRESEWLRVVTHEFGHTLGFPHEHMLPELVARLHIQKTLDYFKRTQGWSPSETRAQVLTPLNMASIRSTPHADQNSIMCYQLPGSITKDGLPITGGNDINQLDAEFIASIYPKAVVPPIDPPIDPVDPVDPPIGSTEIEMAAVINGVKYEGILHKVLEV